MLKIIYANEEIVEDGLLIFLAGPTPRFQHRPLSMSTVKSWREDAVNIFNDSSFNGSVLIPESRDQVWHNDYMAQIEWEEEGLSKADCIMFWIPRDIENNMPGFTTNIEWGRWESSGKVVLGCPDGADKMKYIKHYADKFNVPQSDNLPDTIKLAIEMTER